MTRDIKVKKIHGRSYAYDMISYWDKEQKKYRKKSIYLGVITDSESRTYQPKEAKHSLIEPKLILSFGDTYSIMQMMENSPLNRILRDLLPQHFDTLIGLLCFKLLKPSLSMQYAQTWASGNYLSWRFGNADWSSQRISDFLKILGQEKIRRKFFKTYIERLTGDKTGIIIDSTGLPNEIDFPLSAWGNHGGATERETRLLMVVERLTGQPLYFSCKAGNIVDVTTLSHVIAELTQLGVHTSFVLVDAGYYAQDNIEELYRKKISFMTRLPSGRTLYKTLIKECKNLEEAKNLVIYHERALYIERREVDLFGQKGFAYLACDIKRKGYDSNRFLLSAKEDKLTDSQINEGLSDKGIFILISSEKLDTQEVLPLYYTRQTAENLFGVSKSFLEILPIRTHSMETFRGYLMLNFIAILLYVEMKKLLKGEFTVEGALLEMTNQMCQVYDNQLIISEPTKKMKRVAELIGYMVPKSLGI